MRQLKVVLTVPQYKIHAKTKEAWINQVSMFAAEHSADLVVFPEAFMSRYYGTGPLKYGESLVRNMAKRMKTSVLSGFGTQNGFETVIYFNPQPEKGETEQHLQYKHVVAKHVAFELKDWEKKVRPMLSPFSLKGFKIGCCNCYEMFVPLVVDVLEQNGTEVFVDLTGANVPPEKWKTIVGGRSLEAASPFLCTMGYYSTWPGKAICLAWDRGRPISMLQPDGQCSPDCAEAPTFSLVTLPADDLGSPLERNYSWSWEKGITVSLGTGKSADIEANYTPKGVEISSHGKQITAKRNNWTYFNSKRRRIGLLVLGIRDLSNREILLAKLSDELEGWNDTQHLVMYVGGNKGGFSDWEIAALASVRVIEHSVAVIVMAGKAKEVFRQTKMRKVMRLQERDGLFAIKVKGMNNLRGTYFPDECDDYREQYLKMRRHKA